MNLGGRPTKYDDAVQEEADRYVMEWQTVDNIPSRAGLCCFIGINKTTSYDWERKHPRFSNAVSAIEALQERVALNEGITGTFNSSIVKLVLANHGYCDKQSLDHTTAGKPLNVSINATDPIEAARQYRDIMEHE